MPQPYLPKLRAGTGNTFRVPTKTGEWEERPNAELDALADAIDVPPAANAIYSIPNPWARAILFDRALFDRDHVLHQKTLGEWRGLLAILGLKERLKLDGLSVAQIMLKPTSQADKSFARVLYELPPHKAGAIDAATGWDPLYVLRWRTQDPHRPSRAFAFTSPMTLLCAGADYAGVLSTELIPWFDGQILRDPAEGREILAKRQRTALAEWLAVLVTNLTAVSSGRRGSVIVELRRFSEALMRLPKLPSAADTLSEKGLGFVTGIYRYLDKPRKPEVGAVTDVQILGDVEGAPKYLLIDPSLDRQWNEPAREITIYGDTTLATASAYTGSGKTSDRIKEDIYWCTPDFFFNDSLICDPEGTEAFPGCIPPTYSGDPKSRSVIFPLNREILTLFTPRAIQQSFSIEWLPDGGAVCRFKVSLRPSDGKEPRACTIAKVYPETSVALIKSLPMICLWPDIRVAGQIWKSYFTFQLWKGPEDELKVEPWSAGDAKPDTRMHGVSGSRFQISRTAKYPEALICETSYYNKQKFREWQAKGMMLIKLPAEVNPGLASSVKVGVDFGSTGSNVYQSLGGSPEPVKFENRIRQITDFDPNDFRLYCRDWFIPPKRRPLGGAEEDWEAKNILSVFHDFGDPKDGENVRLVLRDGHVLFADDPTKFLPGNERADRTRIISDLKWGGERQRLVAKDFLNQLCLQTAVELANRGVKSAKLRFSYPTAFSNHDYAISSTHWNSVTSFLAKYTGIEFALETGSGPGQNGGRKDEIVDNREAVAAARFFVHRANRGEANVGGTLVTMDIGGGTTDIALWRNLNLCYHNSILFAGRDLFLAPLRKKPELLVEIEPRVVPPRLQTGVRDAAFHAHLDAVIATSGEELIKALPVKEARPSVKGFLQLLELGLCGIGFYAGLMLRHLFDCQKLKREETLSVSIFAGGNGSKMFRWCALGYFTEYHRVHEAFTRAFLKGAQLEESRVIVQLSADPKSEVAFGLVNDETDLKTDSYESTWMAGESFTVDGTGKPWNEFPTWENISALGVRVDPQLPIFKEFLEATNRKADPAILDYVAGGVDHGFAKISAQHKQEISRSRGTVKGEELMRNEPIFIMALKTYLEREIDEWAKSS